jgi:hypothetical protein
VLTFGCRPTLGPSSFVPEIPVLKYTIQQTRCSIQPVDRVADTGRNDHECSCLLTSDLKKLVLELKAACLALGNSDEVCQTEPTE